MFELIKVIIDVLFGILPDSPFRPYIDKLGTFDFLGYLNWIIPFDACVEITSTWLVCIFVYYNYGKTRSILDRIIDNIFNQ